jgi:hypothetical protein
VQAAAAAYGQAAAASVRQQHVQQRLGSGVSMQRRSMQQSSMQQQVNDVYWVIGDVLVVGQPCSRYDQATIMYSMCVAVMTRHCCSSAAWAAAASYRCLYVGPQ